MDISLRNVVVAKVSFTSVRDMLLWLRFRVHRCYKCCCGYRFVHIVFGHVDVAKVS